jgi:hypothetical protein
MAVALARLRMPLIYLGLAAVAVDSFLLDLPRWPLLGLLAVAFAIHLHAYGQTYAIDLVHDPADGRAPGSPGGP